MGIKYYENERIFKLDGKDTTYLIAVVDDEKFVGHIYYGSKIEDFQIDHLLRLKEAPFVPTENNRDRLAFYDSFPWEYPTRGIGDFREDCLAIETKEGHWALKLTYQSHKISHGKQAPQGLPGVFGDEKNASVLELICEDAQTGFEVTLIYTIFEDSDAIIRSTKIFNKAKESVYLTKALSACIDMDNAEYDLITLHGSWARERHIQRRSVGYGSQGVFSVRGESGHQDHPFLCLAESDANQDHGAVYGMNLIYSGNFTAQVHQNQFESIRMTMGIHPDGFRYLLEPGEFFQTPEVVIVYSDEGIGKMSREFHDLYRNHLIRSSYKDKKRPILINNWEATYFNFDTDKLLAIAKEASSLGIEMLVMDDGWFGNRSSDNCALGDWDVNEEKIKGGLSYLVEEVNKLGMKFGIWFEPEMISPDSNLYRKHPDWAIAIPGKTPGLARNQLVLDFSRKEVVDYVYGKMETILKSANIEYVKWDMNRPLSDIGSAYLPSERQGELYHRYVLGVYELQERLIKQFPELLLENCSGGGARFDPGMLYYSPQIWCSDDTDAIERLSIQEGTAIVYPLSTIGAHVSDCPNHTVGRITPFETRGYVALAGTFGYELDVTKIPREDRELIPAQVEMYHKYNDLIRMGDYYRIASYRENHYFDCWQVVSKDKKEALLTYIQVLNLANSRSRIIKLKGLDPNQYYKVDGMEHILSGNALMCAGICMDKLWGDFRGSLISIQAV